MNIDSLNNTRIGVATTYGKPYFKFTQSLRRLNLRFDSILPQEIIRYNGNLVLTTRKEAPKETEKPMLFEEIIEKHPTIIRGLIVQKLDTNFEEDQLVLGVDPGSRIGLSVFYRGREIESSLHASVEELVYHVIMLLAELRASRKIVKIGNGNMKIAKEIGTKLNLRYCSSFELAFVDESGTSLKIKNHNQRGKRDMLSAKYITQREGFRHLVLPLSITG